MIFFCGPQRGYGRRLPAGLSGMPLQTGVYAARRVRVCGFVARLILHARLPDAHFVFMYKVHPAPERGHIPGVPAVLRGVRLYAPPESAVVGIDVALLNLPPGLPQSSLLSGGNLQLFRIRHLSVRHGGAQQKS